MVLRDRYLLIAFISLLNVISSIELLVGIFYLDSIINSINHSIDSVIFVASIVLSIGSILISFCSGINAIYFGNKLIIGIYILLLSLESVSIIIIIWYLSTDRLINFSSLCQHSCPIAAINRLSIGNQCNIEYCSNLLKQFICISGILLIIVIIICLIVCGYEVKNNNRNGNNLSIINNNNNNNSNSQSLLSNNNYAVIID